MFYKRSVFHIWNVCFTRQDLSYSTMHFEHATLTVTFGLLLKSFNVANNLICTISDIIFKFRWTSVPSLYSWNIAECDVKPQQPFSWHGLSGASRPPLWTWLGTLTFSRILIEPPSPGCTWPLLNYQGF